MRPTTATLLLTLALPALLEGQGGWKDVGKTSTGNMVRVDPRSVSTRDSIIGATFRVMYTTPTKMPKGLVSVYQSEAMFNCAKKTVAVKKTTMYADVAATKVVEVRAPKIPGFGTTFTSNFSGVALAYLCKGS